MEASASEGHNGLNDLPVDKFKTRHVLIRFRCTENVLTFGSAFIALKLLEEILVGLVTIGERWLHR